jgi:hypothetical protein
LFKAELPVDFRSWAFPEATARTLKLLVPPSVAFVVPPEADPFESGESDPCPLPLPLCGVADCSCAAASAAANPPDPLAPENDGEAEAAVGSADTLFASDSSMGIIMTASRCYAKARDHSMHSRGQESNGSPLGDPKPRKHRVFKSFRVLADKRKEKRRKEPRNTEPAHWAKCDLTTRQL